MLAVYIMLAFLIVIGIANLVLLIGMGLFVLKLAARMEENRGNVAASIEDIVDSVRLMRGNMEDFKNFIRSVV